tara:strand:+ start:821 stop:1030 length:210 start_codon:yes stop_codon:yes gene_type:complete
MSNQRKSGKKLISSYVFEQDKEKLQAFAAENGLTMSDVLKAMVSELDNLEGRAKNQILKAARSSEENEG